MSNKNDASAPSAWPFISNEDLNTELESDYAKKVREAVKDALRCPHCDELYFECDALNEDTGERFCPECGEEIKE